MCDQDAFLFKTVIHIIFFVYLFILTRLSFHVHSPL